MDFKCVTERGRGKEKRKRFKKINLLLYAESFDDDVSYDDEADDDEPDDDEPDDDDVVGDNYGCT